MTVPDSLTAIGNGRLIETKNAGAGLTTCTYAVKNPINNYNFILYRDNTREGITMTAGVLDRQPGGADPEVKLTHIPGGRVITATHWGDYGQMKITYDAIEAEIKAKGLKRLPKSLEIYGDWYDDISKVRTDIHIYLAVLI